MGVVKVTLNNSVVIDITDTTATAQTIQANYGAYGVDGEWMDGAVANGNSIEYGLTDGTLPLIGVAKIGSAVI